MRRLVSVTCCLYVFGPSAGAGAGQETMIKAVYSKDGKSRTETVTGTDAQGKKIKNVTLWDKQ